MRAIWLALLLSAALGCNKKVQETPKKSAAEQTKNKKCAPCKTGETLHKGERYCLCLKQVKRMKQVEAPKKKR